MSSNPQYNVTGSKRIVSVIRSDGGYELIPVEKNTKVHPQVTEDPINFTGEDDGPYWALNRNLEKSSGNDVANPGYNTLQYKPGVPGGPVIATKRFTKKRTNTVRCQNGSTLRQNSIEPLMGDNTQDNDANGNYESPYDELREDYERPISVSSAGQEEPVAYAIYVATGSSAGLKNTPYETLDCRFERKQKKVEKETHAQTAPGENSYVEVVHTEGTCDVEISGESEV
jgi:hypothetical protein